MDAVKEKIHASWKEIIMNDEVAEDANFLESGGTSVNIIQLYGFVEDEYPETITIDDIFSNPSVTALAAIINERLNVNENESSELEF